MARLKSLCCFHVSLIFPTFLSDQLQLFSIALFCWRWRYYFLAPIISTQRLSLRLNPLMSACVCIHRCAAALYTGGCCVAAISTTSLKDILMFAYGGACLQREQVGQVGLGPAHTVQVWWSLCWRVPSIKGLGGAYCAEICFPRSMGYFLVLDVGRGPSVVFWPTASVCVCVLQDKWASPVLVIVRWKTNWRPQTHTHTHTISALLICFPMKSDFQRGFTVGEIVMTTVTEKARERKELWGRERKIKRY